MKRVPTLGVCVFGHFKEGSYAGSLYVGSLERRFLCWEFVDWVTSKRVPTQGHFKEGSYAGSLQRGFLRHASFLHTADVFTSDVVSFVGCRSAEILPAVDSGILCCGMCFRSKTAPDVEQGRAHAACDTAADSLCVSSSCWGFSHGSAS